MLNLIEIFTSIQGETSYSGLPTTFIRLAACNLRCSWCDTTYSFKKGTPVSLNSLAQKVKENGCHYVCITGGEPLLQKEVYPLMTTLADLGYHLSLETGGSLPTNQVDKRVKIILDVKCPGSGMENKNFWPNLEKLTTNDEVKFVILDEADFLFAKEICLKHHLFERKIPVLFSPVFGNLDPKILIEWMLKHRLFSVRLNLQIHKWIWAPETQGV